MLDSPHKSESGIVKKYGLLFNNFIDAFRYDSESEIISNIYIDTKKEFEGYNKNWNVIIVQIESLFSDVIELSYNNKKIAPFLYEMSKNSIYFPYCLSMHGAGGTSDCEFSVVNSVVPPESYPGIKLNTYCYPNSFLKELRKKGYVSNAFHGNDRSYFNRDIAFPKMGFDHFFDIYEMNLPRVHFGAADESFFYSISDKMRIQKQPFCNYLITISSHEPFTPIKKIYNDTSLNGIRNSVTRDYLNSISYVDMALSKFLHSIEDLRKNSIIFIFGDHPVNVPELNFNSMEITYEDRGFNFVPLMILTPDSQNIVRDSVCATFLDIAPTILAATSGGCIYTQGQNLLKIPPNFTDENLQYYNKKYSRRDLRKIVEVQKKRSGHSVN